MTSNDVSASLQFFCSKLKAVFDDHAPFVEKRIKGKKSPWLSCEVKKSMNDRDKLLRKARKSKNEADWVAYKRLRNYCTNLIKRSKASFRRNLLAENIGNPRKFWSTIKTIFPSKSMKSKDTTAVNVNCESRANKFSTYFKNAITTLKLAAIPFMNFTWRFLKPRTSRTCKIFTMNYISKNFIEKELCSLKRNKATGLDELPSGLLKGCAKNISEPLCYIMNLSIKTSIVPNIWKSAKVVPIFKSGNHDLPENYRPISVLPVLSKVFEKAIHYQLLHFLETNKLLSDSQFGFRKYRSTKLAAALLCDNIRKEMNNGNRIGAVYLDLSKAFDTIGHGLLLNKLNKYGVSGKELNWFTDYLFNRTQIVEIENVRSDTEPVYCGVPQGSILGPLLFIVLFNDLVENLNCHVIKYADDTVIYYGNKDIDVIEKVLNSEMECVGTYCRENELVLNLKKGKTEAMLFGTAKRVKQHSRELKISYNGTSISFVSEYVYLGNVIDSTLTLQSNFNRAYKRASNRLRLLKSVREYLDINAATKKFNMMILPILSYAGPIKLTYTQTQKDRLISLLNRAKDITGNDTLGDIHDVIQRQNCMLVRKCLQQQTNSVTFNNYFEIVSHTVETRNNNYLLRLPQVKLETAKQGFLLWWS